jgi:asparagine synthase (glutamine-hydrolysing)
LESPRSIERSNLALRVPSGRSERIDSMCGLVGVVSRDPSRLREIERMNRAIRHRGPDDEGYLFASSSSKQVRHALGPDSHAELSSPRASEVDVQPFDLALGHRRLSILDLSAGGHQPMASADGGLWIVYNGEIYNYLELRTELEALGHRFRTASDTEVLLAAWREWGTEALPRLNGMWAIALVDLERRVLTLARDRFGEKPLYYVRDGDALAFSSELEALSVFRAPEVDENVFASFLAHGTVEEGERTFFKDVRRVPPGGLLSLRLPDLDGEPARWYELPHPEGSEPSPAAFAELLDDSIRLRLRSDVPVGTCLSGGLDSSAIAALSSRRLKGQGVYHAFSAVFADEGFSEAPYVTAAVAATGVQSHIVTPQASELANDFVPFVRTQGEPVPSLGSYIQYRIAREAAANGVKVLLDGQGADELLAGYHYQAGPHLAEVWRTRGLSEFLRTAGALAANMDRSPLWLIALAAYHRGNWPASIRTFARRRGASQGVLPLAALNNDVRRFAAAGLKHQPTSDLDGERRRSLTVTSLPALLRYEDRNTMRFAVEARLPFLDFRLVEAALTLSSPSLFRGGWTKSILRDAVSDILPETITRRRNKMGFATPEVRMFREAASTFREILANDGDLGGRVDREFVKASLAEEPATWARTPYLARWCASAVWLRECVRPRPLA